MPSLFYIGTHSEFATYWPQLKQVCCPHCKQVGFLNRHGFLRGYDKHPSEKIHRGWRIYCSNRGQREGCGGTHALLLADFLRRRTVTTSTVWSLFTGIFSGLTLAATRLTLAHVLTIECAYRLWNSWEQAQGWIRSYLCRISAPPVSSSPYFLFQSLEHLQEIFPSSQNPLSAFQLHFQKPFFPSR